MDLGMQVPEDGVLLRIFLGEDEKFDHLPLHEAIVLKAREMHLAGATVIRGPVGFGHSSRIHTTKLAFVGGSAAGDRNCRPPGQDRRIPAGAQSYDGGRLGDLGKGQGSAIRLTVATASSRCRAWQ